MYFARISYIMCNICVKINPKCSYNFIKLAESVLKPASSGGVCKTLN